VASDESLNTLLRSDWMEAFNSHPRIGESRPSRSPQIETPQSQSSRSQSVEWSAQEQRNVADAEAAVTSALADANREYEQRFDRTFIVCAAGKSAPEILAILRRRLNSDSETEFTEACEQQRQITRVRLRKWLQE
jgi:2-oxo-4-hydroxy-4-carboxy-5-ureidoimidazoline decarboxylase